MRIIQIEDYFHPEAGYQINILSKYLAKFGHEVVIISSEMKKIPKKLTTFFGVENIKEKDDAYSRKYGVRIVRLPLHAYVSGRAIFGIELFKTIQVERPDIVFVHGNDTLTGMRYLLQSRKLGYPLVMDSHMLEMASNNHFNKIYRMIYRTVFTPMIIRRNIPVIRTQNDPYVERCLGIPLKQCPWISVGSDTLLFHPDLASREEFRKKHQISKDAFVVIYAGKLDEEKGGLLLANAIKEKFLASKEVVFLIVGKTNGEYGKQVENILTLSKNRVLRFQTQKYQDLAQFYQASDLSVFPRQCSLSFYDAQACGLPVLSENNAINIDRNSHNNGFCFLSEDTEDLRNKLQDILTISIEEFRKMSYAAINFVNKNFNYENIARKYESVILSEYRRYHA